MVFLQVYNHFTKGSSFVDVWVKLFFVAERPTIVFGYEHSPLSQSTPDVDVVATILGSVHNTRLVQPFDSVGECFLHALAAYTGSSSIR